jgi:hypothetical protein
VRRRGAAHRAPLAHAALALAGWGPGGPPLWVMFRRKPGSGNVRNSSGFVLGLQQNSTHVLAALAAAENCIRSVGALCRPNLCL